MGSVLAEVIFPSTTGLLEDSVVNTFAFITPGSPPSASDTADIAVFLTSFYNNAQVATSSAVAKYMSTSLSRVSNAVTIKTYNIFFNLDGSPHGSPIATAHFTLGPAAALTNLPSECAVCLSYHSNLVNIAQEAPGGVRPAARHRGRLYIGPLNTDAMQQNGTTHVVSVNTGFQQTLAGAAITLSQSPTAAWAQWSRRDAATRIVTGGFVDNAFDTQRRRGETATLRTPWGATV